MTERTFDDVLAELEKTIARLADGTAPIDELVAAHQRALELLTEAQARLTVLKGRAGPQGPGDAAELLAD